MSGNTIEIESKDRWFAGDVDVNVSAETQLDRMRGDCC